MAAHTDGEVIAALGRMLDSASPDAFGGRPHEAEAAREALVSICRSLPLFQHET